MNKERTGWRWRDDEITMKEFYNQPQQEKDEYIFLIQGLKPEEISSMDEILLNRFGKKQSTIKFLEL